MWILKERFNPNKHPMMPEDYPWLTSETYEGGWEEVTEEQYQQLLQIDRSAYIYYTDRNNIPNATPRQFRQALILSGISLATVENAIGMLPEPDRSLALVEWEYSVGFVRANPLIDRVGQIVGKTPEEIDGIWSLALSL